MVRWIGVRPYWMRSSTRRASRTAATSSWSGLSGGIIPCVAGIDSGVNVDGAASS
jgi:hypothetical protein